MNPEDKKRFEKIKPLSWDSIVIDELGKKIVGEVKGREAVFLNAMGRLVKNAEKYSFNILAHAEPNSGKDYLISNVLKIFPKSKILSRTRLSPTVLNYWEPWLKNNLIPPNWDEKVLYVSDVGNEFLNSQALKQMCSDGSHVTITNKKVLGGVEELKIEGNPALMLTTATSTPNNEIISRFGILKLDESEEQTKNIFYFIPKDYGKDALSFVGSLRACKVEVPKNMRDKIADVFPRKLRDRRNFGRFLDYIRAVAVFHQTQRDGFSGKLIYEDIVANWKDYDIAKDVFMNIYSGVAEIPLTQNQKKIIETLTRSSDPLDTKEILSRLENYISLVNFRPHLNGLVDLNVLDSLQVRDFLNNPVTKYKISSEFLDKSPIKLPNSEDLGGV